MTTNPQPASQPVWPSVAQYRKSIRREFALYIGGFVVTLLLAGGLFVSNQFVTTVTGHVVDRLIVQARSYAGAAGKQVIAADGPDVLMLNDICKKLMIDDPECRWVGIADGQNRYLAHSDMRQVIGGAQFATPKSAESRVGLADGEILAVADDSIFVAVPITEQGITIGTLALSASTGQIHEVRRSALITVSVITLAMVAIGVPFTTIILRRRLRPLYLITESLRKVEIGNLRFDPQVHENNEFGFLADTLRVMGDRLEQAREVTAEAERMTRELEIAREIQFKMLPKEQPQNARFDLSGVYRSALTVGGDYYDFIELDEHRLGILVADVSGKSLPGMLVMLLTRDLVMKHALRDADPASLLSAVNKDLLPEIRQGMFVTMQYGVLDTDSGEFCFASAGHNPLIHVESSTGQIQLLKTKGFPLGLMGPEKFDARIESSRLCLNSGDWCILYTDGINEAMNSQSSIYGMDRLLAAIANGRTSSAPELSGAVIDDVHSFVGESPQSDDITLLALRWLGDVTIQREHQATGAFGVTNC
jgi:serine phosphatase RsbU (regulator of sigma subunit)